jgi:hypothetical protein
MLYAIDENGKRVGPSPKTAGVCPVCGNAVVSKCGEKVVWHWSHKTGSEECDAWYEPITEWHKGWMSLFPESSREALVFSQDGSGGHMVDVCLESGMRVDFQSRRITVKEMGRRDSFWGGAFWVLDAAVFFGGLRLRRRESGFYRAFEIVEGWHYEKGTVERMKGEILSLSGKLALAVNYVSQESRNVSRLVFELWSEDRDLYLEVLDGIRRINSEYMRGCANRRTPWVLDCTGEAEGSGMWLENMKGVSVGSEYAGVNVYVDGVEGAEGRLFDMSGSVLVERDVFLGGLLKGDDVGVSSVYEESESEWLLLESVSEDAESNSGRKALEVKGKGRGVGKARGFGKVASERVQMSMDFSFGDESVSGDWSGLKLRVELIPSSCWYSNVRSEVSKGEWDVIRKKCFSSAGHVCEICGDNGRNQGFGWPVECHEIWDFDMDFIKQTLKGFISLCPYCHKSKHIGLSQLNGEYELALSQIMKVNSIGREEAERHVHDSFAEWEKRSAVEWDLDITYIESYMKEKKGKNHGRGNN